MKIDLTTWSTHQHQNWAEVFDWLAKNLGEYKYEKGVGMAAKNWRLYKIINVVEGVFEDTYWLEIDNDTYASMFMLRWL